MPVLEELQPKKVFHYFEEISRIPRASRNTLAISNYLAGFAAERGLKYIQDEYHNIIIFQNGTAGYEEAEPIIIQGHMDMVCEKEEGVEIDFEREGISLKIEGDFLTAEGTTLGGDDGIAVAYALAILDSKEIAHPPLEVVLTVDEEIGMLGAYGIDLSMLKGHKMLNLDSDVEGQFLMGCAGGMSLVSDIPVRHVVQEGLEATIHIHGLCGGHSGSEIDKERGNAAILMGRVLSTIADVTAFGIVELNGGSKDNAIVREAICRILLPPDSKTSVDAVLAQLNTQLKKEFAYSDPNIEILYHFGGMVSCPMLDFSSVNKIIYFLRMTPNGVLNRSQVMENLVETSLNLGIMQLQEESFHTVTSIRSSVSTRKTDTAEKVALLVEMLGGEVKVEGDYPAWEYKEDSAVRKQISEIYRELFGKEAQFESIHAGLECGIFSEKIPNLDCVSFGPMNFDIHTPKERLSISSTERIWKLILEFLKRSK
jgi:dipeptidase D